MKKLNLLFLAFLLIGFTSCSSDDDAGPQEENPDTETPTQSTFSMNFQGDLWEAESAGLYAGLSSGGQGSDVVGGVIEGKIADPEKGTPGTMSVVFVLDQSSYDDPTGTYPILSMTNNNPDDLDQGVVAYFSGEGMTDYFISVSGEMSIDDFSKEDITINNHTLHSYSHIKGTFHGTFISPATQQTTTITDGKFDVYLLDGAYYP